MTQILGHNYIGGQRSAQGSVIVNSVDATTGQALPYDFYQATAHEVDRAACAAAAAYPAYKRLSAERRAAFLDAIADELDALDDQFVALVCRETALPAARIAGERGRTSGQMRLFATVLRRGDFYAARIDQALPERTPLPRPDVRQYRIGLGPVAVFGRGVQGAQRAHGDCGTGGRCHFACRRAYRHASRRVQHDLWRRRRGGAGQAPVDSGRGLHRIAQGRARVV